MLRFWHLWSATFMSLGFVKGNDWVAVGRGHTCETGAGTARYVNIGTRSSDECRSSCLTYDWCGAIYTKDGQSKSGNDCGLVCGTGLACDFAPPEGRYWQGGSGQCSSAIDRASGDGQYTCLVRKDWEASEFSSACDVTTVGAVDITIQWAVPVQPYAPRTVSGAVSYPSC